ncbi:hypothetical protein N4G70_01185 [Streptomyces sp. ASQP_92]|nr:hypothetical protein [Streptomyces sp. ASQP_92]MCT9087475.1 hypothetical protein [Streptomyces sp. ASQP_92]
MGTNHSAERDAGPRTAVEALKAALARTGLVLPSLGIDDGSSLGLVNLGRVRPDVALRLAVLLSQAHDTPLEADMALEPGSARTASPGQERW